jgi:glucosamine--fructose-6-phosphate aminotransferase (isomerizing)
MKCPSYTFEEILSQPEIWQQTLYHLSRNRIETAIEFGKYEQVLFTGCGSTYYLSLWASRWCEMRQRVLSRAVPSSDLLLFPSSWLHRHKRTLLVAISRSARTTETIRAVERFQAGGYGDCVVVTCYPDQPLAKLSPWVLGVPGAGEKSVVQTRSFSNMMLAVAALIEQDTPLDLATLYVEEGTRILKESIALAEFLGSSHNLAKFVFLGSGPFYGLANEAMLKGKEMSLTPTEAFHFMEFRHGPISIVDRQTLVVGLLSEEGLDYELDVLKDVHELGAYVVALSGVKHHSIMQNVDHALFIDEGPSPIWYAPLYLPFLQLLAYYRAISKGLDPDHPVHLKAVVELQ